ncbi:MAG: hypothetical protein O7E57_08875 [Gammaproteobacteria bacterium]|nr:hypothetical protein [Gammaproteobacteria bacterium]
MLTVRGLHPQPLAVWDFAGVVLFWFGAIEMSEGIIIIALAIIGQSVASSGTIRGWRSVK